MTFHFQRHFQNVLQKRLYQMIFLPKMCELVLNSYVTKHVIIGDSITVWPETWEGAGGSWERVTGRANLSRVSYAEEEFGRQKRGEVIWRGQKWNNLICPPIHIRLTAQGWAFPSLREARETCRAHMQLWIGEICSESKRTSFIWCSSQWKTRICSTQEWRTSMSAYQPSTYLRLCLSEG